MSALAVYLNKISEDFMNSFEWRKNLTEKQLVAHKISNQINTDCHNGYTSNIIHKMVGAEKTKFSHRSYFRVGNDLCLDEVPLNNIPTGVILRRLTNVPNFQDRSKGFGRNINEVTGTLYFKVPDITSLKSTCKVKTDSFQFGHSFYWEVPTVEEIDKVLSFSTQQSIEILNKIFASTGGVS